MTQHKCEACGEPAAYQDAEGVWLCADDYLHLVEHWYREFSTQPVQYTVAQRIVWWFNCRIRSQHHWVDGRCSVCERTVYIT